MFGPIISKEEAQKRAKEERSFAAECDRSSNPSDRQYAARARQRAMEYDDEAASWFTRWFGL